MNRKMEHANVNLISHYIFLQLSNSRSHRPEMKKKSEHYVEGCFDDLQPVVFGSDKSIDTSASLNKLSNDFIQ